ncbi:MAG: glycosyltransferase [Bacteroidia bacterium]
MIVIELILLLYFLYVVFYTLVFSLAGVLHPPRINRPTTSERARKIAVLIPAYKEDAVIISSATRALHQSYSHEHYEVVVIADNLRPETMLQLRQLPIRLVEVSFEVSTKVKALRAGMAALTETYDLAVILDADNVMENDFLEKISASRDAGFSAIQGRRTAKNSNTKLAVLDGLSEMLNNHIYRQGSSALGLSASLSGSAMAFDYSLLAEVLADMDNTGGFDRDMEVRLGIRGVKVRYVRDAVVYDEKVAHQEAFANQRRRWIASQYQYLAKHFITGMKALFRGDFSLFNSAVFRNIQLPRVINIGLLGMVAMISIPLHPWLNLPVLTWWGLLALLGLALALAVPLSFYNRRFFQALITLPGTFFTMFTLLFKLKGANKQFIHTPHGETENEVIPGNKP